MSTIHTRPQKRIAQLSNDRHANHTSATRHDTLGDGVGTLVEMLADVADDAIVLPRLRDLQSGPSLSVFYRLRHPSTEVVTNCRIHGNP